MADVEDEIKKLESFLETLKRQRAEEVEHKNRISDPYVVDKRIYDLQCQLVNLKGECKREWESINRRLGELQNTQYIELEAIKKRIDSISINTILKLPDLWDPSNDWPLKYYATSTSGKATSDGVKKDGK